MKFADVITFYTNVSEKTKSIEYTHFKIDPSGHWMAAAGVSGNLDVAFRTRKIHLEDDKDLGFLPDANTTYRFVFPTSMAGFEANGKRIVNLLSRGFHVTGVDTKHTSEKNGTTYGGLDITGFTLAKNGTETTLTLPPTTNVVVRKPASPPKDETYATIEGKSLKDFIEGLDMIRETIGSGKTSTVRIFSKDGSIYMQSMNDSRSCMTHRLDVTGIETSKLDTTFHTTKLIQLLSTCADHDDITIILCENSIRIDDGRTLFWMYKTKQK